MNKFKTAVISSLLALFLILLSACGSSSTPKLEGEWKAQTGANENVSLVFDKDTVSVNGEKFDYKQKSVKQKGEITYYEIEQNGGSYTVIFPDKDKNIAVMIQPSSKDDVLSGKLLYAMNKKEQPSYSEYAKKYIQ
ncbi:glycosyltransferase [Streptococcus infantis]|jgi:hypothetical protein|uniref:glycosyltransferase n=1 Tax=Streptococcus infantis TaxID=68892 RepID=UPI0039C36629